MNIYTTTADSDRLNDHRQQRETNSSQDFSWPLQFDNQSVEAVLYDTMNTLDFAIPDDTTSRIVQAAHYSNIAAKSLRSAGMLQEHHNTSTWSPHDTQRGAFDQQWSLPQGHRHTISESSGSSSMKGSDGSGSDRSASMQQQHQQQHQQQTYLNAPSSSSFLHTDARKHDNMQDLFISQVGTLSGYERAAIGDISLQHSSYSSPTTRFPASDRDNFSSFGPNEEHILDFSQFHGLPTYEESMVDLSRQPPTSSLLSSSPFSSAHVDSPSISSWPSSAAVHPSLISPSFQSLQQPPSWLHKHRQKEEEEEDNDSLQRWNQDLYLVPDSLSIFRAPSTISGLALSLGNSPSMSCSEGSFASAQEHFNQQQQQSGRQYQNTSKDITGEKSIPSSPIIAVVVASKKSSTSKSIGSVTSSTRLRSKWQLHAPTKSKRVKGGSLDHITAITTSSKKMLPRQSPVNGQMKPAKEKKVDKALLVDGEEDTEDVELRYTCPHPSCGKHFSTSGHARRHSRIHTNLRPFICPHKECKSTFTRRDNCTQHQRSNHHSSLPAFRLSVEA